MAPATAYAQAAPAVVRAQSLREAGDLEQAVLVLRAQLAEHPDDGDAARLLAQTLYWLKDVHDATVQYEDALKRHPDDATLRVQYARMLIETGSLRRGRELLAPLPDAPAARAEAEALLGLIAYWDADLTSARRRFATALQLNPADADAKNYLDQIETATAPWVRARASAWHDDQPLGRGGFELEGGWFATPLTSIAARVQPARYDSGNTTRTIQAAGVTMKTYAPSVRIDTQLAIGFTSGSASSTDDVDWTGGASVAVHVPPAIRIGARASRSRYLYTVTSIAAPVMVNAIAAFAHLDHRGWLGDAAFEGQRYPDDNSIRSAYGWLLAPVARNAKGVVQVGYAVSASDAAQSRFVLQRPAQRLPPGDPRFDFTGIYSPYYTPDHVLTQSVIAAAAAAGRRATFHVNGSYGFAAHENAPLLAAAGGAVVRVTTVRHFTPWNARAALSIPLGRRASFEPSVEVGRTVFYSWSTADVQVTWRLTRGR